MIEQEIKVGQVWRRRSDGQEVTIAHIESSTTFNRALVYVGKRRTWIYVAGFVRKFEFVKEGGDA